MPRRLPWWLPVIGGVFLLLVGVLIAASVLRPSPPVHAPTPAGHSPAADSTGVFRVTLDARDPDRWIYYDFSARRVRRKASGGNWDLAARRFHLVVNGGAGLPGEAAVVRPGSASLAEVRGRPRDGWIRTRRGDDGELRHPLLADWYRYDFFSHLLLARPEVYLLRTVEGDHVKLQFVSYYCPGTEAGCVTFRFAALPPAVAEGARRSGRGEPGGPVP